MQNQPYQLFINLPFGELMAEQTGTGYQSPYKFNGNELDPETGLYYYGARYYDPHSSTWLSVDPLAEKYAGWTPYNYCVGNPVVFVDPDGRKVELFFFKGKEGQNSGTEFSKTINSGLGGQFEVYYTSGANGGNLLHLKPTKDGGDFSKMPKESIAFYNDLSNMSTDQNTTAKISVYYGSSDVAIGNYKNNAIDIADVNQYDDMGKGLATKQGKLIHEIKEQYGKATDGIKKGNDSNYKENHQKGVSAENRTNGSTRGKESYTPRGNIYSTTYTSQDKKKTTTYTYRTKEPIIQVKKTPN